MACPFSRQTRPKGRDGCQRSRETPGRLPGIPISSAAPYGAVHSFALLQRSLAQKNAPAPGLGRSSEKIRLAPGRTMTDQESRTDDDDDDDGPLPRAACLVCTNRNFRHTHVLASGGHSSGAISTRARAILHHAGVLVEIVDHLRIQLFRRLGLGAVSVLATTTSSGAPASPRRIGCLCRRCWLWF